MKRLRLATRRSPLALVQAEHVRTLLDARGVESELVLVATSGDLRSEPLSAMGGQGVFAVEIQHALLEGRADVAVHSAKDLPSLTPDGLVLAAVPERRDPADVLVGRALQGLGPGATVATGSPRRRALLLERRPDLHVVELRGNMATRLEKAGRDGVDAVVAAAAALERLDALDLVAERLDPEWFVPQVGQGALALECRRDDDATREVVAALSDARAELAVRCERAFLVELGVGCTIAAGAHATVRDGELTVRGVMLAADGSRSVRAEQRGGAPEALGAALARQLRDDEAGSSLLGWAG